MTRHFAFAIADSMFPANCSASRRALTPEEAKGLMQEGYTSCCNPQHRATNEAAKARYGLEIAIPEKAPIVALSAGDEILVMSVRGLLRLEENRHEYTEAEIAKATFTFGVWTVGDLID